MLKQAISAEFKKQRIIVFIGVSLGVLIYVFFHLGPWRNPNLNFDFFHFLCSLILLAIASCAGGLSYSPSKNEPRASIHHYLLKLAIAAFTITFAGVSIAVSLALSVRLDSPNSFLYSLYPDFRYLPHTITYFSGAFLAYACAVLFSLLLEKPGRSGLAGFVFGSAVLFAICSFWVRLDFNMWTDKKPINSTILLTGVLLLYFSWRLPKRLKKLGLLTRITLGISAAIVTALCASTLTFFLRPSASPLHMGGPNLSPKGTEIVSDAYAEDTYKQIWTIPTDTGKGYRIFKRHAYDPAISPDGRWFAFLSQKGLFGLRSFNVDLRAATIDGTKENVVLPGFARWISDEVDIGVDGKAFSPDSKYIALLCYTMIYVVDLQGNIKSQAPLPPKTHKQLLGWRSSRLEVLLADYDRRCIETYDLAKREFRPLYQANQKHTRIEVPIHSDAGIRYVVFGNELVDVDRGSAQPFPEDIGKGSLDISTDQSTLIYSISSEELKPDASSASIHRFEIKTGRDELYARFRGVIERLVNSPDGNKIAFERRTEFNQLQTVVMTGNSLMRKFEGWALMGWRDSGRVVLADNNLFPKRMALGNIATGQVHQFYP